MLAIKDMNNMILELGWKLTIPMTVCGIIGFSLGFYMANAFL